MKLEIKLAGPDRARAEIFFFTSGRAGPGRDCSHAGLDWKIRPVQTSTLYTEFLPDIYKKFQVASTYDTNVDYQMLSFCRNLFLSYAHKRHIDKHTHIF